MSDWRNIRTDPPAVGDTVIVGNDRTGDVFPAYSFWGAAPFPLWCSLHAEGMGRCKPTHWQPLPTMVAGQSESVRGTPLSDLIGAF